MLSFHHLQCVYTMRSFIMMQAWGKFRQAMQAQCQGQGCKQDQDPYGEQRQVKASVACHLVNPVYRLRGLCISIQTGSRVSCSNLPTTGSPP